MRGWHRESLRHSLAARGMAFKPSRRSIGTASTISNTMLSIAIANMMDAKTSLEINTPEYADPKVMQYYVDEFLKNFDIVHNNLSTIKKLDMNSLTYLAASVKRLSEFGETGSIQGRLAPSKNEILALMTIALESLEDVVSPRTRGIRKKYGKIPGGLAEGRKLDLDPKQLAMGQRVEMEHTRDPAVATEIAMDHLTEDPRYYTKLKRMEAGH